MLFFFIVYNPAISKHAFHERAIQLNYSLDEYIIFSQLKELSLLDNRKI